MYIQVTTEHIERARQLAGLLSMASFNPLALAIRERLGGAAVVFDTVWATDGEQEYFARLPRRARLFLNAFKKGQPVQPARFRIALERARYHRVAVERLSQDIEFIDG